jgi:trk system potassium uptake protein TrkH
VDFDAWPAFSKGVLFVLMAVGACGGSTGGGMKVSRLGILIKSTVADFKKLIHPRAVVRPKFEGQVLDRETENNVKIYFVFWILILILSTLLLSLDVYGDLFSNLSATLACISNVGPGFGAVGPMLNYSAYSELSKVLLCFVMLIGRLEIFPMLILFAPRTWKKG